jgi:hypothetical protein
MILMSCRCPDPSHVASLAFRSQESLLTDIEELITSLASQGSTMGNGADGSDEIDQLVVMTQQYSDCGHDPSALFTSLGKLVCRDQSTEMHAYKHHQATYEEFHDTRPSLRGVHLVAATQGAALTRTRDELVFRLAGEQLQFESQLSGVRAGRRRRLAHRRGR